MMEQDSKTPEEILSLAAQMLKRATAEGALASVGCRYIELFTPHIEKYLEVSTETGDVFVNDDKGNRRYGVTPKMLAEQIRAEFDPKGSRHFTDV